MAGVYWLTGSFTWTKLTLTWGENPISTLSEIFDVRSFASEITLSALWILFVHLCYRHVNGV